MLIIMKSLTQVQKLRHRRFVQLVAGFKNQELAGIALGMSTQQVSNYVTGSKGMGEKLAERIELSAGKPAGWLSTDGDDLMDVPSIAKYRIRYLKEGNKDEVTIKQFKDIRWAAGAGSVNSEYGEIDDLSFKRSYMERNNLRPESCIAAAASGRSMEPTINDGDIMLINLLEKNIRAKDGLIFAFVVGNDCRVKRVFTTMSGDIRLVSDNLDKSEYPDEIITASATDQLHVAGRVRWSGGDK